MRAASGERRANSNPVGGRQNLDDVCLPYPSTSTHAKVRHRPQLCHPDRSVPGFPATRHSPASTCAAFSKESRMKSANATKFDGKSGVA